MSGAGYRDEKMMTECQSGRASKETVETRTKRMKNSRLRHYVEQEKDDKQFFEKNTVAKFSPKKKS